MDSTSEARIYPWENTYFPMIPHIPPGFRSRQRLLRGENPWQRLQRDAGEALERLQKDADARGVSDAVLVTHGNVIRALMSHYTSTGIPFRQWTTENCGGWTVNVKRSPIRFEIEEDRRKGWLNQ